MEISENVKARIIPKSSLARDGVYVFNLDLNGKAAIVSYCYGNMPEGPASQIIFFENDTKLAPSCHADVKKTYS